MEPKERAASRRRGDAARKSLVAHGFAGRVFSCEESTERRTLVKTKS